MKRVGNILAALSFAAANGAAAAEPPAVSAGQLIGKTLSAVAFVPHPAGMPGGGELSRIMLQAYLAPDGRALVRAWDTSRDAYTVPAERRWSLTGDTFCLDVPLAGPRPICADIHIWGPRIAGVGARPYAMLDGDLQPGNVLGVR
ncbi:MAG TPA: hypothetical protein VG651_02110 [Stellaceae bacterium]|nr:hypothetical protein [Stellaceae bacterium]